MVKASVRGTRRMTKKMNRVLENATGAQSAGDGNGEGGEEGVVPSAVLPVPLPEAHLMTRREVMLKRKFSAMKKASKGAGATGAATTAAASTMKKKAKSATKKVVAQVDHDDGAGDEGGEGVTATVVRKKLGKKKDKFEPSAMAKKALGAAPITRTSMNLSAAKRHELFVSELNHFKRVSTIEEFSANPLESIKQHLDSTMRRLVPQTPDIGRRERVTPKPVFRRRRQ